MFNPLTTVSFMRCYRDTVLKAVRLKRVRVGPLETAVSGLSMATASMHPFGIVPSVFSTIPVSELNLEAARAIGAQEST